MRDNIKWGIGIGITILLFVFNIFTNITTALANSRFEAVTSKIESETTARIVADDYLSKKYDSLEKKLDGVLDDTATLKAQMSILLKGLGLKYKE